MAESHVTRIAWFRESEGLTQQQLADRLGVDVAQLAAWESGAAVPDDAQALALSGVFAVAVSYLLGGEG